MDLHRLGELRSLAYHREIARRIETDPALVRRARARAARWLSEGKAPWAMEIWQGLLAGEGAALKKVLTEDSESARRLRSCTPFAGELTSRERWRIWADVRRQYEGAP
jgi:hypothetical protein